jgi:predicted RNase H-like nuclease
MKTLLVGFDSAWTSRHSGAIAAAIREGDGQVHELGKPQIARFDGAEKAILDWQRQQTPVATVVLIDQPTIVKNPTGQRPVEKIVASPVSRRRGGMQPAYTGKEEMFGESAPLWPFLKRFDGPADPMAPLTGTRVFETYPVLAIIALGWTVADASHNPRLPKYNPERKKTFSINDWKHVCQKALDAFRRRGLMGIVGWIEAAAGNDAPSKSDQDCLDACLCLLVALHLAEGKECLMVGNTESGYIVVPHDDALRDELCTRCGTIGWEQSRWLRVLRSSLGCQD